MWIIIFDNSEALNMFKSCNAMRVKTDGVEGPVDGQYIQVIHFR